MNAKYLFLITGVISLAGCASIRPVGLCEVEHNLKQDFRDMGYTSFCGLISEDETVREQAESYIREQQRFFKRANPLLITCTTRMDLSLKGIVTSEGQVKIAAKPQGLLGMEGIFGASSQTEQTIPFPITVVSLGALPGEYLASAMADLNKSKDIFAHFTPEQRKKIMDEIYINHEKLKEKVKSLQADFN